MVRVSESLWTGEPFGRFLSVRCTYLRPSNMTATSDKNPLSSAIPKLPFRKKTSNISLNEQLITPDLPKPKLRLHVNDLRHVSSTSFLQLLPDLASRLETALGAIIKYLYTVPPTNTDAKNHHHNTPIPHFAPSIPPTRSVTVILHDFSGVAYTTGTELDDDHKEIHFSLSYIRHCCNGSNPIHEIVGVFTHELVHCYQHTAPVAADDIPRPPGGLIEGIADFVRLKAGLDPPHWKRPECATDRPENWDQGYQHTAYFLAWLEDVRIGRGAVGMLNDRLLRIGYVGEDGSGSRSRGSEHFWKGLFGVGVLDLWEEYGRYLDTLGGRKS